MAQRKNLWVQVEFTIKRNPKFRRLSRLMGADQNKTLGMLVAFWSWTLEQTVDGVIDGYDVQDIADGMDCDTEETTIFITALTQCGWLDTVPLRVHNWDDGPGKARAKQRKDAARQKKSRDNKKDVTVTSQDGDVTSRPREEERRLEDKDTVVSVMSQ